MTLTYDSLNLVNPTKWIFASDGGGGLGLMGAVASASYKAGGSVLGIMPDFLSGIEKTLYEINHVIVKDMHERKMMMYDKSDAFIVLPGGIGTLEEAVEILSWSRLNLHNKPIIFLDNTNYWDSILKLLNSMSEEGFIPSSFLKKIIFMAVMVLLVHRFQSVQE